jgi:7-carboxy-7-deazaguanine synthase
MFISEIFHSLQGEGSLSGVSSLFIRTSGCNLRCNWCDTPYASWKPEGTQMSVEAICKMVISCPAQHVVLTGGEPMIAPEVRQLAGAIRSAGKHLTIETAATIPPENIACDLASLSPKLSNSAPDDRLSPKWKEKHNDLRWQPDVVRAWIDAYPTQLKFVICSREDLEEVESMLDQLQRPIPPENIFLMPEGITTQALQQKALWLAEVCQKRGYRYGHRLQIDLYGNTRGT